MLSYIARCVGGKGRFIELARLSTDRRLKELVRRWDVLSTSDKRYLSIEDLAEASGMAQEELFGAVGAACLANEIDPSPLLAACFGYHDLIVATLKGAQRANGFKKRERILKNCGFLG